MSRIDSRTRAIVERHARRNPTTVCIAHLAGAPHADGYIAMLNEKIPPPQRIDQRDDEWFLDETGTPRSKGFTSYFYELESFDGIHAHYRYGGITRRVRLYCDAGHPLTPENTYRNQHGSRYCKPCHIDNVLARRARKVVETNKGEHMRGITDRQQQVFNFIIDFTGDKGYPPSFTEIADGLGLASRSTVSHHVKALHRKGYISVTGEPRAIRILKDAEVVVLRSAE